MRTIVLARTSRPPADGSERSADLEQEAVDYFGFHNPLVHWKARRSLAARRAMFDLFVALLQPGPDSQVLDVGVTPDRRLIDSNAFEHFYPFPHNVVATSYEDASAITEQFPGMRFVRTDGDTLPFDDQQFDIAVAWAVLEHVGDREAQRRFLSELLRTSKQFFVTTPNRWFPLELHTFLPLLHWLPQRIHQAVLRRIGLATWAETGHLNLLGARDLAGLMPPGCMFTITGHRLLGWRSNLIVHGRSELATPPGGSGRVARITPV